MKNKKLEVSGLYIASILTNAFIFLSFILFIVYLIAPFVRGDLSIRAIVVYGSWIGLGFAIKYYITKYRKKMLLNWYETLLFSAYGLICMFLWFSYPYNIISSLFIVIGNIVGNIAQRHSWGKKPIDKKRTNNNKDTP